MKNYGKELILDLHECDTSQFTREKLVQFFEELAEVTDMELAVRHFWDTEDLPKEKQHIPHLIGTSAIQFITTSNFTIHTLDVLKAVYLNIFTCKDFDPEVAKDFCAKYFRGKVVNFTVIDRV